MIQKVHWEKIISARNFVLSLVFNQITHNILWNLNQVFSGWIARIVINHIGVRGILPINIDCCEIDAPGNDALTVSSDSCLVELNWKVLDLGVERIAGYDGLKIGFEGTLIEAVGRLR